MLLHLHAWLAGLVVQLTETGHAPIDPVLLRVFRWQFDLEHIVGRVSGCGEGPPASTGLINRTGIGRLLFKLALLSRLQPHL